MQSKGFPEQSALLYSSQSCIQTSKRLASGFIGQGLLASSQLLSALFIDIGPVICSSLLRRHAQFRKISVANTPILSLAASQAVLGPARLAFHKQEEDNLLQGLLLQSGVCMKVNVMTAPDAYQQPLWLCRAMGILVQLTLCLLGTVLAVAATVAYKLHQLLGPFILRTSWNLWMQGGEDRHRLGC